MAGRLCDRARSHSALHRFGRHHLGQGSPEWQVGRCMPSSRPAHTELISTSQRHNTRATAIAIARGQEIVLDAGEKHRLEQKSAEKEAGSAVVKPAEEDADLQQIVKSELDIAVNEHLTVKTALQILRNPRTWLPALSYLSSFGYELAIGRCVLFFSLLPRSG
jgi:hypothetical protein